MTFSYEDMISPEAILADALVAIGDEKMKYFTSGWYQRQVRTGLDMLNYNAPFIKTFKDIALTSNLVIPVPKGVWDTIELYLWNGGLDCEDTCKIESAVRLFHKRGAMTKGYGYGYVARNNSIMSDTFLPVPYAEDSSVYFYTVHMGNYMLSDQCINFQNLRVVYNGLPRDISTTNFIPPYVRECLVAFVVEKAFAALKATDIKFRPLWSDAKQDLYERRGTEPSKWDKAESLLKREDKKAWNDLQEYLSQLFF